MKTGRLIILVIIGLVVLYQRFNSAAPSTETAAKPVWSEPGNRSSDAQTSSAVETDGAVPQKAYQVLAIIRRTGDAPEGYVGGRVFQNREHRLPADGDYREFDVDPHHGQRNAERLIVEWGTKKAWYTGDHYQTFIPLP